MRSQLGDKVATFPFDDLFIGLDALHDTQVTDWESPDLYRWSDYRTHITALKAGREALVAALHPESAVEGISSRLIEPRPIVVVAGFLALHDAGVNNLFGTTIFIDLPEQEMIKRRLARAKPSDQWDSIEYIKNGLLSGYRRHVEPQRDVAKHVIDGTLLPEYITEVVIEIIREKESR